jgi:hypothetical protein
MDDDLRNEIARASAEHDRLMAADAADGLIYTEPPIGSPPVRRAADARGLVYRGRDAATADAPQPAPGASNGDGSIFDAVRDKRLAQAIGVVAAELRREFDDEIELLHQLLNLAQVEVDKLRGEFRTATMKLKRELSTMGREIEADRANGIEVYCGALERRVAVLEADNIKLKAMLATRATENAQPRGKHLDQNDDKIKALAAELERERADRQALFDAFENRFSELRAFVRGTMHDWTSA